MRIGLLPLGRTTFDMDLAGEKLAAMLSLLNASGHVLAGSQTLLTDPDAADSVLGELKATDLDALLVLQVTFADATFVLRAAALDAPIALWAVREPREGGRLRLNSFCGLNLAAHALGRAGHVFSWLYADPDEPHAADGLAALLAGKRRVDPLHGAPCDAEPLSDAPLSGVRIMRIGAAPDGFITCDYDAAEIASRFGAQVDAVELGSLFETARAADPDAVSALHQSAEAELTGLDAVDQSELERSLRLKLALDTLRERSGCDAFAVRCWPETFTEYGGAVCGAVAMLGERRVPCACEADVWGALTQIALQRLADAPVFLVDLVDVDIADNSAVVWHCGQAPLSMAAGPARATIHTNRKMPLLYEFALKPGRVTFLRLSQALGEPKLVIAEGEVLDRPMAFTGTSGVVRFDAPADTVLSRVMDCALEHHMALAYGDHGESLRRLAAQLALPVVDLTTVDGADP